MHSAEIVSLPVSRARAAPKPIIQVASREIDVGGIGRRLGLADRPVRAIIDTIRRLIDKRDFPLPKTPRFVKGEPVAGSRAVTQASRWDRDLVEDWFDAGDRPPPAAAAQPARKEATRAQLAARAEALAG